jgi:PII-like signaling protein
MQGYQLTFFCQQDARIGHERVDAWLIALCRSLGIGGITVRADAAGFGSAGRMHSAGFFELGDQPMEITLVASAAQADEVLARLQQQHADLFYLKAAVEFGRTNGAAKA